MRRLLVVAAALAAAGCAGEFERRSVTRFEPTASPDAWRYVAATARPYPLDTPAGEAVRMGWLERYLRENGACPNGYDITDRRPVVVGANALFVRHEVHYGVACR